MSDGVETKASETPEPAPGGEDMHLHRPKPLHGLREIVTEVGVIVIGIVIAIGAEQLVETMHWRHETEQTDEGLHAEVRRNLGEVLQRATVIPCVKNKIESLAARLDTDSPDWRPEPGLPIQQRLGASPALPVIFSTPEGDYSASAWRNASATKGLEHMSRQRLKIYSLIYNDVDYLSGLAIDERQASEALAPLAFHRRLNDTDRINFVSALAKLDRDNVLFFNSTGLLLEEARSVGVTPDADELSRDIARLRAAYGGCATEYRVTPAIVDAARQLKLVD